MVKIYVKKIRAGQLTIEDVPEHWRTEVQAKLVEIIKSEENA